MKLLKVFILLVVSILILQSNVLAADSDPYSLAAKLIAGNLHSDASFGVSVAISANGARVVASAPNEIVVPWSQGQDEKKGMVFSFDRPVTGVWIPASAVIVPRPEEALLWGEDTSLAISSDGMTVAISGTEVEWIDVVWVFEMVAGSWVQKAKLAGLPKDTEITSVSISGDASTVVAGAAENLAAYVFNQTNGVWESTNTYVTLVSSDSLPGDDFGSSVSITVTQNGSTVAVGADEAPCINYHYDDDDEEWVCGSTGPGKVYIFEKNTVWGTDPTILSPGGNIEIDFGALVALSSDGLRVGVAAPMATIDNIINRGAVYLYEKQDVSWGTVPIAKLISSDLAQQGYAFQLGISLAINSDGSRVAAHAVGATVSGLNQAGAVYIFMEPVVKIRIM